MHVFVFIGISHQISGIQTDRHHKLHVFLLCYREPQCSKLISVFRMYSVIQSESGIVVSVMPNKTASEGTLIGLCLTANAIRHRVIKLMLLNRRFFYDTGKEAGCYREYQTDHKNNDRQFHTIIFHVLLPHSLSKLQD